MIRINVLIRIIFICLPALLNSQHDWKTQRDWVIGEYVGYQVDSTARPDIKVPFTFYIKYSNASSRPAPDNDTTVSIDPKNLWFKVRKDSVLVPYPSDYPWLNEYGRLFADSTLEFLYIEPFIWGGGHRIYNWGKRVKLYIATEDLEDPEGFKIWPNPSTDILNLNEVEKIRSISIFNSQGDKVLTTQSISSQRIDISNLQSGFYWIQLLIEGKNVTKQFLKVDER